uniref:hypothetical protein n=1 Tax=Alistipes shahii TaxID=328814 RepID=UPI00307F4A0F
PSEKDNGSVVILSRDASSCLLSARWENHEQSGFTDLKNKPVILFNPFFPLLRLFPYICALTNTKPPMK